MIAFCQSFIKVVMMMMMTMTMTMMTSAGNAV